MKIETSMSELEKTDIVVEPRDLEVALNVDVVAESQPQEKKEEEKTPWKDSQIKEVAIQTQIIEKQQQHEEEEKSTTTTMKTNDNPEGLINDENESIKDVESSDETKETVSKTSTDQDKIQEKTIKRDLEEDLEPVLKRIPSNQPSCGSNVIHITKNQFTIGRKADNDEVIVSVLISRKHCTLQCNRDTGEWSVTNESSTDTLLNDDRLERNETRPIKPGDILQLSLANLFKYKFCLVNKESESVKFRKLESNDSNLGDMLDRQNSFVELQKSERKDLEKQLTDKQLEQEKLKKELDELLENQKATKVCNEELNNQIVELQKKIDAGNATELELQHKYRELLEKLEEEKLKFEEKLAEEKQRCQEALEESKQEQEKLKVTYAEQLEEIKEQLVKKQQEEWQKKVESLLQEEKNVQSKLQSEKQLLEQKLTEMAENLKKKDEAAKVLQVQNLQQLQQQRQAQQHQAQVQVQFQQQLQHQIRVHQQQQLPQHQIRVHQQQQLPQHQKQLQQQKQLTPINLGKCILVEVRHDNVSNIKKLPVMETIDLTKADGPSTSSSTPKNNLQGKEVIDKVSNIMDEQLTCSICSELFIRAMTLNCMHTFCRHCIDIWSKRRKECPNCRAAIITMTRSLVVDNFIEKMLESLTPEQMQKRKQLVEERQRLFAAKKVPRKVHRRR